VTLDEYREQAVKFGIEPDLLLAVEDGVWFDGELIAVPVAPAPTAPTTTTAPARRAARAAAIRAAAAAHISGLRSEGIEPEPQDAWEWGVSELPLAGELPADEIRRRLGAELARQLAR